jgi:hypothetical protein
MSAYFEKFLGHDRHNDIQSKENNIDSTHFISFAFLCDNKMVSLIDFK